MSTTRLLVLGVVRIFQPVHGYFVRRELLSWDIERWANINPGSIYNALRSLTREGYFVESDESPADRPGKPADRGTKQSRTTYRLTPDGQNEFVYLLRDALWQVDQWDNSTLLGGLSFMTFLHRDEIVDAMEARISALRGLVSASQHTIRDFTERRAAPPHTAEHLLVTEYRWAGELDWCEQFLQRVRDGYYIFNPEPGWDAGPARDGSWPGPRDKPSDTPARTPTDDPGAPASGEPTDTSPGEPRSGPRSRPAAKSAPKSAAKPTGKSHDKGN